MSDQHDGHVGHIVPMWLLIAVGASLTVLTVITVTVTRWDFGYNVNLLVAMIIATVKAALVALYFMHLRWDKPFNGIVFIGSLAFAALFVILALIDTSAYHDDLIPEYAPAVEQLKGQ